MSTAIIPPIGTNGIIHPIRESPVVSATIKQDDMNNADKCKYFIFVLFFV